MAVAVVTRSSNLPVVSQAVALCVVKFATIIAVKDEHTGTQCAVRGHSLTTAGSLLHLTG